MVTGEGKKPDMPGREVSRGEEVRLIEILAAALGPVNAFARRLSDGEGDDVASEVLLVAWRRREDVLAAENPTAWLLGVTRRVAANRRRSAARAEGALRRVRAPDPGGDPAEVVVGNAEVDRILAALGGLDGNDRTVLVLAARDELGPSEIAAELGISVPAAKTRLYRARRRLEDRLEVSSRASPVLLWEKSHDSEFSPAT